MIRFRTSTTLLSCAAIMSTTCFAVAAPENFRVRRPPVTSQTASLPTRVAPIDHVNQNSAPAQNDNALPSATNSTDNSTDTSMGNPAGGTSHVYSGSAQVDDVLARPMSNVERGVMIQQRSIASVQNWERGKMEAAMAAAQQAMNAQVSNTVHHGILHHMASAAGDIGKSAAIMAATGSGAHPHGLVTAMVSPPTITIEPGHCPAATDPAFQVPYSWWQDLSVEETSNPIYRDPWAAWLGAVKEVFKAHTPELQAHGIASIHVIINPDGSIYNMTPFYGEGRSDATSLQTQDNMRQIIAEVGNFPPFPIGTHVRCYHLIFDARYQ
ncbi:MAG TPA: hypothetical protein V6C76_11205 [Drouetiella sp.]